MACTECKKKKQREELEKQVQKLEKWIFGGMILVFIAASYGIYTLISKFI
jgi:predicted site-specific integrase-resolvase